MHHLFISKLVQTIVWDFDGTFYQSPDIEKAYIKGYLQYLQQHGVKTSQQEFLSLSDAKGGWSLAAAELTGKNESRISQEVDGGVNKLKFMVKNEPLVDLIYKLKQYNHIIFTNSHRDEVLQGLPLIGFLSKNAFPFQRVIGRETGFLKPDEKAFLNLMKKTGLKPFQHLMIGDSYHHDITPAKKLGMFSMHINEAMQILPKWIQT